MEVSTTIPDFACGAVLRPRAHSLEGISRAKIRSVKQTVVVILGYIICSAPAIIIQLWKAWIDGEQHIGMYLGFVIQLQTFRLHFFRQIIATNGIFG